ncbi:MAG: tetratricopeptide repeat protein [Bacteroidales bacterium]
MLRKLLFSLFVLSSSILSAQQIQPSDFAGNDALFRQGKELFAAGNFGGCISQLDKLKQTIDANNPKSEEIDYMIAASAFETENIECKEILQSFLNKYPFSNKVDRVKFLLGTIAFIRNQHAEAIRQFRSTDQTTLSSDEQQDYIYRLAYSLMAVDSVNSAQPMFIELTHSSPKYSDAATYYTAWYNYKDEVFDKAADGFESIRRNPEFSENANFYLTQIQFIRKQYDGVIQSGEAIFPKLKNKQHKAELARILGESFNQKEETTKAIEFLTYYAENDNSPLPGAMYQLGTSWFIKQDYAKAIQYLKFATAKNDELGQSAYYYLGCSYLKVNDKKNARLAFEIASTADFNLKTKELSLYNYAMLIFETAYTGFNEAVTIFEQFLNSFPKSNYADKVSSSLTEVYMTSKDYQTTLASIEKIKYPNSRILGAKQRILFEIGTQELINGNNTKAKESLEHAIALGDREGETYAESHYWCGEIAFRKGRFDESTSYFQSYINNTAGNNKEMLTLAYYNLGYSFFKNQLLQKAQNAFEKALGVNCKKNPAMTADLLNRIGDCRYFLKDYNVAQNYYARAAQASDISADYSLFQQAQILSLQKQYNAEIKLLDKIGADFPNSDYQDDALFEKGHTYQNMEKRELAIEAFSQLIETFPKSSLAKASAVQLGVLYLGQSNVEKSIEWYKYAISNYPESDESTVANEDLKRIYKDQNRIGEYVQYIKTLDGKVQFTASEQDSLVYLGAEKSYMKGQKAVAERSFIDYLKEFPNGVFSPSANYYLAMINIDQKKDEVASGYLDAILARPENKYTETALSYSADIAFAKGKFDKALEQYGALEKKTESSKTRLQIWSKLALCNFQLQKFNESVDLCSRIIDEPKSSVEQKSDARYYRAKSTIQLQKTDNLASDLTLLSAETRTQIGAEAKFLLADYYFKTDNLKKAESEIFDYIEKGTPHQHWLARSFILLTDIYLKNGDNFQAKQYLISLKNNYKEKDEEIEKMIEERMPKVQ